MDLGLYYKSVLESDDAPIVLCDLEHVIIYMNEAAVIRYGKRGGRELLGRSLFDCHSEESKEKIIKILEYFKKDISSSSVFTFHNDKENKDVYMVALRDDDRKLIGYYEKHCYRNREERERYKEIL